jgi:hypothetical protein
MKKMLKSVATTILAMGCVVVLFLAYDAFNVVVEGQTSTLQYVLNTARVRVGLQDGGYNSFAAQTATGATAAFNAPTSVFQAHTIQLTTTGAPTGCTYRLQGSNDGGTTWFNVSAADITCTSSITAFDVDKVVKSVRGNLLTLSGGTAPTVQLKYLGR